MISENEYHNIVLSPEVRKYVDTHGSTMQYEGKIEFTSGVLEQTILTLASRNPTWRITINDASLRAALYCRGVTVTVDGAFVGGLTYTYVRGASGVQISSPRLARPTNTSDVKRALAVCRKVFVKPNRGEKLVAAQEMASTVIQNTRHRVANEVNEKSKHIRNLALTYAMHVDRERFEAQLRDTEKQKLTAFDEVCTHMQTIESVTTAFTADKTALIVRDGEMYIVKAGDGVALYTSAELPEALRGKVGMLKLCEIGQMVDGVGCRVNEEVFVVLM